MKSIKQFVKSGAVLLALSLAFTSCDELIGELDNIAPSPVTPTPEPEPEPKPEPTLSKNYRVYTSGTAYTDVAIPAGAIAVESSAADVTWSAGTYVVEGNKTITGDIKLTGDVNLILRDGAELKVNGRGILVTHGHNQNVDWGVETLGLEMQVSACNTAFYGHTHVAREDIFKNFKITIFKTF